MIEKKNQVDKKHMKILNITVKRAKSSSAAQRRKPPQGKKSFWETNQRLLVDNEILKESDYQGLRNMRALRGISTETKSLLVTPQQIAVVDPATTNKGLFSQNNPQLYFHNPPAKVKDLPNLSGQSDLDIKHVRMPSSD